MLFEEQKIIELVQNDDEIFEVMKRIRNRPSTHFKELIQYLIFDRFRDLDAFFNPKRYYLVINRKDQTAMLYEINKKGRYHIENVTNYIDFNSKDLSFNKDDDFFEIYKKITN